MLSSVLNPSIGAGELNQIITIQSQDVTPNGQDETGEEIPTWDAVLTTRAAIATASSREAYQTGQFSSEVTHIVKLRWPGSAIVIAAGMQILLGSRTFLIQAIENVQERNRVLRLMCLEINGAL